MIRMRVKMKARYAILLCMASVFGVYTVIKIAVCCDELTHTVSGSSRVLPHADIVRRSLVAKGHDSRTLLRHFSETPNMADVKTKFAGRAENKKTRTDAEENLFGNSNHETGEKFPENQQILAHDHTKNDATNQNKYQNDAPAAGEQAAEQYRAELDKKHKKPTLQRFKNDKANENEALAAAEKSAPQHEEQHVDREQEENHQNELLGEEGEDDNSKEGEKGKKSIKTIFDPGDSEITYHALRDEEFLKESLINKSREDNVERTTEFPMTPKEAMRRYGDQLPAWEQFEILHFPKIYYLGLVANKTQLQYDDPNNFGFDDEADPDGRHGGHYKIVVGDHIGYRYEILKFLGSGHFGAAILARDWSNPVAKDVALKIMHYNEKEKYILKEINMMKYIEANASNLDYFSRMVATFQFRNHKCLVLELLGKSVHRHNIDPVRNMTLFRRLATDILLGMNYLAEMDIVHGDLKPGNIMFILGKNNQSAGQLLKVADFGIGCIPGDRQKFKCPTHSMQTLHYKAPEVILSLDITPQLDMFSVGVIFTEFFIGRPPFHGETETDQLATIMEVLGLPPTYMIAKSPRKKIYRKAICYETEDGFHRKPYRKPLPEILKGMEPVLFDLIARCLEYDPKLRITPQNALRHPFITGDVLPIDLPPPVSMKRLMGDI